MPTLASLTVRASPRVTVPQCSSICTLHFGHTDSHPQDVIRSPAEPEVLIRNALEPCVRRAVSSKNILCVIEQLLASFKQWQLAITLGRGFGMLIEPGRQTCRQLTLEHTVSVEDVLWPQQRSGAVDSRGVHSHVTGGPQASLGLTTRLDSIGGLKWKP